MEEKKDRRIFIYDIETIAGIFTYTGINIDTEQVVQYVIHKDRNDLPELINHLMTCKGQIGFNNMNFDYPVIHHILNTYWKYLRESQEILLINNCSQIFIDLIYKKAQEIIGSQSNNSFNPHVIRDKDCHIPQLDLFKVWHYDNKARSTSLKSLEISMNYPNVMEMPISHTKKDISKKEIDEVLEYNLNDVLATYEFYKKTLKYDKIDLRKSIIKKYDLKCLNWNNGKIGENLILKLYCDKLGLNPYEIKKLRSERSKIALKDCIPSSIKFTTDTFNKLLQAFSEKVVDMEVMKDQKGKKGNKVSRILYKDCIIDYALGGAHGVTESGIYESDDKFIIKSCDVASLYPWLPIVYKFWIEHLGPEFLEIYRDNIVQVRLNEKKKPKSEQDKAIVDGYKEAANIPYGKSNDKNSFLYDPLYTMKTTVAGQLATSMLCEQLGEIPECTILMYNTDGLEVRIPRTYEGLYKEICDSWQKYTGLELEFVDYQKMWIADINNYGCISSTGKIKNKGRFEVDKVIGNEPAYHKDNSFKVVPLAIQEYYIKGIPIKDTIMNHDNIYDFCGRQKFRNNESYGTIHYIKGDEVVREEQQKNVRYYISNKGATFIKNYSKGGTEVINKGYQVTIFNNYIKKDWKKYDLNYEFYIKEAQKEIDNIVNKQYKLEF